MLSGSIPNAVAIFWFTTSSSLFAVSTGVVAGFSSPSRIFAANSPVCLPSDL